MLWYAFKVFMGLPYLYRMQFSHISNAAVSRQPDRPMMQKEVYPVSDSLQQYLQQYQKDRELSLAYTELLHYSHTNAIKDANGKHTHWERVVYDDNTREQLYQKILVLFAQLKNNPTQQFSVSSIDFCEFANSMPFRINLVDDANQQQDYFYIKTADASRIFGLELEQLLTSNHINFLYHKNTLVEEHIEGIPGDDFLPAIEQLTAVEKEQLSIAFIRFNEQCFARLLGDMRSYNFVILKNDGTEFPFSMRSIDFDQQCYEGKLNLYLPQFFKENYQYVHLATATLEPSMIENIRLAERKSMTELAVQHADQLNALLELMGKEEISDNYKVVSLRRELNDYHRNHHFSHCKTMGAILQRQLTEMTGLSFT